MSNETEFRELAEALWAYFEPKIDAKLGSSVSYYRAQVAAKASAGKIGIKRPFDPDDKITYLPYVSSIAGAQIGTQVTVLCMGSDSNAIIVGNGVMSNL